MCAAKGMWQNENSFFLQQKNLPSDSELCRKPVMGYDEYTKRIVAGTADAKKWGGCSR